MRLIAQILIYLALGLFRALAVGATPDLSTSVYTLRNSDGPNMLAAYLLDPKTGSLIAINQYPTGGTGLKSVDGNSSHALALNGRFLFAVNPGDNSISSFEVASSGTLRLQGVYSSGGTVPVSLAVSEGLLFALNQGSMLEGKNGALTAFTISPQGDLQAIPGASLQYPAQSVPTDVLFTPGGKLGVSLQKGNKFLIYTFGTDRKFRKTQMLAGLVHPFGGAVFSVDSPVSSTLSLTDQFLLSLSDGPKPGALAVRPRSNGHKSHVSRRVRTNLIDPCWVATSPKTGAFWLSSFMTRTLSLFMLNAKGDIQWVSDATPIQEGPGGLDLATSPDGNYLFRLRAFDTTPPFVAVGANIDVFRISSDLSHAGLTLISSTPLPRDWNPVAPMGILAVQH